MREKISTPLGQYSVKGKRLCLITHNFEHAARILDIIESWDIQLLLVGTTYVYRQVRALLPKMQHYVRFRLFSNIQCIALEKEIQSFKPDYLFSYFCFKKISDHVINSAELLAVNFHPSLLPLYKGAAPHALPIINGDSETGVSVHKLTSEFDCGEILLQLKVPVVSGMTESLINSEYSRLMLMIFIQFLIRLDKGSLEAYPNPKGRPLAPARKNKDFWFNPALSAVVLDRLVRAYNGRDSLMSVLVAGRKHFSIQEVSICHSIDGITDAEILAVGELLFVGEKALLRCGEGYLWIHVVLQMMHGVMSINRYRMIEGLEEGDCVLLQDPATLSQFAAIADDKAVWYIEAINQYFK